MILPFRYILTICTLSVFVLALEAKAENLVFNSGFELGTDGFVCNKYLRPQKNKDLELLLPLVDLSTFTGGQQSLKITNPYAESYNLQSKEFPLVPGKTYTVSLDMKSSVDNFPVTLNMIATRPYRRRTVKHQKELSVNNEWKRYSFKFTAFDKDDLRYYYLRLDNGKKLTEENVFVEPFASDLWLDNISVREGDSSAYEPGSPLELAVNVAEDNKMIARSGDSATAGALVKIHNSSAKAIKTDVCLNITDPYGRQSVGAEDKEVVVAAGSLWEKKYTLKFDKFGAYRLDVKAGNDQPQRSVGNALAVIHAVSKQLPEDKKSGFSVAFDGTLGWREYPYKSAEVDTFQAGFSTTDVSPDERFARLAKIGCKLLRVFPNSFAWSVIEPQEGKFNFAHSDRIVAAAEKYGIKLAPCLGEMEFMPRSWGRNIKSQLPEWLQKKSEKSKYPPMLRKYGQQFIHLPPVELWQRYVRALAQRYKGRITYWEIMNEPNLFIIATDYLLYLKAAYQTLKEVDSNNRVVGFCATGDLGGSVDSFLGEAFSLGGLGYADIVAFHPYHSRSLASPKPADEMIANAKALLEKYGKGDMPLWNTELFYIKEGDDSGDYQPQYYAHRFLTDLGEGVAASMCVTTDSILQPRLQYYQSLASEPLVFPDGRVAAYNTLASLFNGATPVKKIRWPVQSVCYVYRNGSKNIAALWHYGKYNNLKLTLALDNEQIEVMDMFGNSETVKPAGISISSKPIYFSWSDTDNARVMTALQNAQINGDNLFSLGAFRLLASAEGWRGVLGVANESAKAVNGSISLKANGLVFSEQEKFSLPASSEGSVAFPVSFNGVLPSAIDAEVVINNKKQKFIIDQIYPQQKVYRVDGKPGALIWLNSGRENAEDKTEASFRGSYNKNNLLIEVEVKDSTPSGSANARKPWMQDCVELLIDTAPEEYLVKSPVAHHDKLPRIFVLPYDNKKVMIWRRGLPSFYIKAETQIKNDGYVVKISIPLKQLGISGDPSGKCLGFEVLVDSVDGNKADVNQLRWNSTGTSHKDRRQFGILYFK